MQEKQKDTVPVAVAAAEAEEVARALTKAAQTREKAILPISNPSRRKRKRMIKITGRLFSIKVILI